MIFMIQKSLTFHHSAKNLKGALILLIKSGTYLDNLDTIMSFLLSNYKFILQQRILCTNK
jgi:hypothetical protein